MCQSTIRLPRFPNSPQQNPMCTWWPRGLFIGCNTGLKEGEKGWTNILEYMELKAMKAMGQPSINPIENDDYQHFNLKYHSPTNHLRYDLTMSFYSQFFCPFSFLPFFISFFDEFFFCFLSSIENQNIKKALINCQFVSYHIHTQPKWKGKILTFPSSYHHTKSTLIVP